MGGTIRATPLLESTNDVTPQLRLVYILISIGLVLLAGLMSGLTLGLMSMDAVDLEVCRCTIRTKLLIRGHPDHLLLYVCSSTYSKNKRGIQEGMFASRWRTLAEDLQISHVSHHLECRTEQSNCSPLVSTLQVLMRSGTPAEKRHAQRIAPV